MVNGQTVFDQATHKASSYFKEYWARNIRPHLDTANMCSDMDTAKGQVKKVESNFK